MKLKINLTEGSNELEVIAVVSILNHSVHSALNTVSFTKLHHHTLLNQMVWLKGEIEQLKK